MRDFRIVMVSVDRDSRTDPDRNYNFVVYHQGINEHEVCKEVNAFYVPFGFEVARDRLTEVIK